MFICMKMLEYSISPNCMNDSIPRRVFMTIFIFMDLNIPENELEESSDSMDSSIMILIRRYLPSLVVNDRDFFSHSSVRENPIFSYSMNPPIISIMIHENLWKKPWENTHEQYSSSLMIATSWTKLQENSGSSSMEISSSHTETMMTTNISEIMESSSICHSLMPVANSISYSKTSSEEKRHAESKRNSHEKREDKLFSFSINLYYWITEI